MSHEVFVIVLTAIVTTAWALSRVLKPLGDALSRRIAAGRVTAEADADHDSRIADLATRVNELEERLDFTERVLLQERKAGELGHGGAR